MSAPCCLSALRLTVTEVNHIHDRMEVAGVFHNIHYSDRNPYRRPGLVTVHFRRFSAEQINCTVRNWRKYFSLAVSASFILSSQNPQEPQLREGCRAPAPPSPTKWPMEKSQTLSILGCFLPRLSPSFLLSPRHYYSLVRIQTTHLFVSYLKSLSELNWVCQSLRQAGQTRRHSLCCPLTVCCLCEVMHCLR